MVDTALEDTIKEVIKRFSTHLERTNQRKTPERFAILEEIYRRTDHFDAEALYIHMKTQSYRVSRATVYNTLELLVNCHLVTRHQCKIPACARPDVSVWPIGTIATHCNQSALFLREAEIKPRLRRVSR